MPKGTSQDEATLNSEKIKPVAIVIIELRLPEGRQTGRQAGRQIYIFYKIYDNLLETFRIVLKALLGLVILNQYCQGTRMVF